MIWPFLLAAAAQTTPCDLIRSTALQQEARQALSKRQPRLAVERFQQASAACPGERVNLLGLAEAQTAARDFAAAIETAQRYLDGNASSVRGRVVLAGAYLMAGRPKEALAEADRILESHPFEAAALKIKGNSAYLLGDASQAIGVFILLLDRHPADPDGAYMLGRIYYQEGQIDLAIGQFERALKTNPSSSYKSLDNLGLCYAAQGDDEKATGYFLAAIKLVEKDYPEYEWPYTNLAGLLLKKGDPQRAFDAASMATKRNPLSARSFYTGAKALDQLDKTDLALNWTQRAASIDPDYSDAWYLMARLHHKLGQEAKANEARLRFLAAKAKEPAKRR